jgi:molecular chaperone DnaK
MRKDAETHAAEDRKQVELAEAKNRGENMVYGLEKAIKEQGDKMSASDREPLEAAIKKVRDAIASNDVDAIKSATSELEQTAQAFRASVPQQPIQPASEAGQSAAGDDDAIDAEFEVKN